MKRYEVGFKLNGVIEKTSVSALSTKEASQMVIGMYECPRSAIVYVKEL